MIKNVNTIEEYRNLDKTAILAQAGRTVSQNSHVYILLKAVSVDPKHRYGTPLQTARYFHVHPYWLHLL